MRLEITLLIVGGPGREHLIGGTGIDAFKYEAVWDRRDRITDFEADIDLINFSGIFDLPRYGSATLFDDYVRVQQRGYSSRC